MSEYLKQKELNRQKFAGLFGNALLTVPNIHTNYLEQIRRQYPDVPSPYQTTWYHSDTKLPQVPQWKESLLSNAEALEYAAQICRDLAEKKNPITTPAEISRSKIALLRAVHHSEDILSELGFKYPMPELGNYKLAQKDPDLSVRTPSLLHNDADRILIWMPKLPSKKRGTDSLIFQELRELLCGNTFCHIDRWHCDFIHIYHPDDLTGLFDVDNYLYKPIIDALVLALCSRDSFDHFSCGMYNLPSLTQKAGCYIHVYKRDEKVPFFYDFETLLSAGNCP